MRHCLITRGRKGRGGEATGDGRDGAITDEVKRDEGKCEGDDLTRRAALKLAIAGNSPAVVAALLVRAIYT